MNVYVHSKTKAACRKRHHSLFRVVRPSRAVGFLLDLCIALIFRFFFVNFYPQRICRLLRLIMRIKPVLDVSVARSIRAPNIKNTVDLKAVNQSALQM